MHGIEEEEPMRHLGGLHAEVSPDGPNHFPVVAEKLLRNARTAPTLTAAELSAITSRTLVLAADDDAVTLEHTIALYRAIADSELAIVPRTSHLLVVEKPAEVYRQIGIFLTTAANPTYQPIRRA